MTACVVTYDLVKPGQDYPGLIKRLEAYPNHWHYQQSSWIVSPTTSSFDVAENLRQELDSGDVLFVQELTEDCAWWGYNDPGQRIPQWIESVCRGT